jgi:hypothetical protein
MLNCYYAHSDQQDGLQVSAFLGPANKLVKLYISYFDAETLS